MSLPTIKVPKYSIQLPSTGEKIRFRPFLVKEEKVLHMAAEAGDNESQIDSIIGVLSECIDGKDEETIRTLPVFDIEYCFLQIRSKSVGEIVKPSVKCSKCKHTFETDIDISKISIIKDEKHTNKIPLSNGIGVVMKYPSVINVNDSVNISKDPTDVALEILISCIDYIYDKENTYPSGDYTKEELETFVNDLTKDNFDKIAEFFETMPKVSKKVSFKCPKCDNEDTIDIEGIENFFG